MFFFSLIIPQSNTGFDASSMIFGGVDKRHFSAEDLRTVGASVSSVGIRYTAGW